MSNQIVSTLLWDHQRETADRFEDQPRVLNAWEQQRNG